MTLSCYCGGWSDPEWWWEAPYAEADAYTTLQTSKRKRCCSCDSLIDVGATVVKFNRWRYPEDDIEAKIHGDDAVIVMSPWYMCERCGDLYWSLDELGFCSNIEEDQRDRVAEYAVIYGGTEA